jgi:hypothetical protein
VTTDALQLTGTSADAIKSIFKLHMPGGGTVLDLTYGMGTFWRWDWKAAGIGLETSDLYTPADHAWDFTWLPFSRFDMVSQWREWDALVFDPPFTANGPQRNGHRHQDRYGSTRDQEGAPQNIHDVHRLLREGTAEACRVARKLVVVKTQDVVESGRLHRSVYVAETAIRQAGWHVEDVKELLTGRRAQPDAARGATVRHFRNRPSIFLIAKPGGRP